MKVIGAFDGIIIKSLEHLEKCVQVANNLPSIEFSLQRDGADSPILFVSNGNVNIAVSVSEKYPALAIRYIIDILTKEFSNLTATSNEIVLKEMMERDKQRNKRPTLILATGCFSRVKEYTSKGWKCVSIALYHPKGWRGEKEPSFAPSKELLRDLQANKVSVNEYIARYNKETLNKINIDSVLSKYNGKVIFLCYEQTGFCHRQFLAKALTDAGYPCHELEGSGYMSGGGKNGCR